LTAWGLCGSALAQTSPYSLVLSETLLRESNVLRAPTGGEQSDLISTTSLILGLNQPFGRQRLEASGTVDLARFREFSELNNTGYQVKAQLDWATLENWQGELGVEASQQLYRFDLYSQQQFQELNQERNRNAYLRARVGVVTEWTFSLDGSVAQRDFSADAFANRDQRRRTLQTGLRYVPTPDLGWSATLRRTRGEYPRFSLTDGADDFTRNDIESGLVWRPSGASVVEARLAWSSEDHSQQTARSLKYWSGTASWTWAPTGKLSWLTRLTRDSDTGIDQIFAGAPTEYTDARLQTTLETGASWQATPKIKLNAQVRVGNGELDSSFNGGPADSRARDRTRTVSIGVAYAPGRSIQLGCNAADQKRSVSGDSTGLTFPYTNRSLSCFGQFGWF
jgi:hypothetical protein